MFSAPRFVRAFMRQRETGSEQKLQGKTGGQERASKIERQRDRADYAMKKHRGSQTLQSVDRFVAKLQKLQKEFMSHVWSKQISLHFFCLFQVKISLKLVKNVQKQLTF